MANKWEALCLVALMLLEEEEENEKLFNKKRKAHDFWVAGIPKKKRTPTARKPATSSSQEPSNALFKSPQLIPRAIRKRSRSSSSPSSEANTAVPLRPSTDIPAGLKERILNGLGGSDLRAVLEKPLRQTDVSSGHGRLSMPSGHLIDEHFLSKEEEALVTEGAGMDVVVVDEELREYKLRLKKWKMGHTRILNLTTAWNDVVKDNTLPKNNLVQLWSFRRDSRPCFAFVKL